MLYNINKLASKYAEHLIESDYDVNMDISQPLDVETYNDYMYLQTMKEFDTLFNCSDTIDITEKFIKGD